MNPDPPIEKPAKVHERHAASHAPRNNTRRAMDTGGLALFHLALVGLVVWSKGIDVKVLALMGAGLLGLDFVNFFSPPKRKAILDPKLESDNPVSIAAIESFAFELFVLFAPPLVFCIWLQFLVWRHRMLSRNELLAIMIAMPVVVGLVTWIMKYRSTNHRVGISKQSDRFIGFSILGIWIGATFFFVVFLGAFLMKCFQ
jgi:hypothetical protein